MVQHEDEHALAILALGLSPRQAETVLSFAQRHGSAAVGKVAAYRQDNSAGPPVLALADLIGMATPEKVSQLLVGMAAVMTDSFSATWTADKYARVMNRTIGTPMTIARGIASREIVTPDSETTAVIEHFLRTLPAMSMLLDDADAQSAASLAGAALRMLSITRATNGRGSPDAAWEYMRLGRVLQDQRMKALWASHEASLELPEPSESSHDVEAMGAATTQLLDILSRLAPFILGVGAGDPAMDAARERASDIYDRALELALETRSGTPYHAGPNGYNAVPAMLQEVAALRAETGGWFSDVVNWWTSDEGESTRELVGDVWNAGREVYDAVTGDDSDSTAEDAGAIDDAAARLAGSAEPSSTPAPQAMARIAPGQLQLARRVASLQRGSTAADAQQGLRTIVDQVRTGTIGVRGDQLDAGDLVEMIRSVVDLATSFMRSR